MRRLAGGVGHVDVVDEALPFGDFLETRDHAQQRRLAAARGAEQRRERPLLDCQAEVGDRLHRAIALGDVSQFDAMHGVSVVTKPHPLMPADSMIGLRHPTLENEIDDRDRQRREHRGRQIARVLDAEGVVDLGDADGDIHLVLCGHGQERPQEQVPGADEGDDRQRGRDAPVHRQVDAEAAAGIRWRRR